MALRCPHFDLSLVWGADGVKPQTRVEVGDSIPDARQAQQALVAGRKRPFLMDARVGMRTASVVKCIRYDLDVSSDLMLHAQDMAPVKKVFCMSSVVQQQLPAWQGRPLSVHRALQVSKPCKRSLWVGPARSTFGDVA